MTMKLETITSSRRDPSNGTFLQCRIVRQQTIVFVLAPPAPMVELTSTKTTGHGPVVDCSMPVGRVFTMFAQTMFVSHQDTPCWHRTWTHSAPR